MASNSAAQVSTSLNTRLMPISVRFLCTSLSLQRKQVSNLAVGVALLFGFAQHFYRYGFQSVFAAVFSPYRSVLLSGAGTTGLFWLFSGW